MSRTKKTLFPARIIKTHAPLWVLRLLDTNYGRPQPQPTQPAQRPTPAAENPDIARALTALEAALVSGADPDAIHTAFTALSHAERQAHWQTGEAVPYAEQLAAWEQNLDALIARYRTDPALADGPALLRRTLRQTPDQPLDTVEVSAHTLYRTFIEEGNSDVVRFARQIATTNTREEIAANHDLIVQLAHMFGRQTATCVLPYLYRLKAEQAERERSSVLGTDIETGEEISITIGEREQALACFGAIGSGKSTLALHLILQDCRQNRGVVLIEPHGSLTRAVLAGLPESRLDDVVYLDLSDCATAPFGLNPFQCDTLQDVAEVAKCANFVHHTFMRTWEFGHHTPVMAMVLRHVTRALIENPGSSFADIPLLFHDDVAREKLVKNVKNTQTKLFWEQYNTLSPRERRDLRSSTENKIDSYLSEPLIANILSQAKTTIDFGNLFNNKSIVLLNLSPQLEEIGRLLGSLILGRILMSAYQRTSVPEAERVPCCVYVDEWSRFCSDDLAVLIAESRKFKVIIGGLFNQTLETISDSNRATALQAGTLVTFRVSGEDSVVLARSYNCEPQPVQDGFEPQRAPVSDVLTHLLNRGHNDAKVAAFAHRYLQNLVHFVKNPSSAAVAYVKEWHAAYYNGGDTALILYDKHVQEGQKLINQTLYTCMSEANPDLAIPMLAIYLLAVAQRDGRESVFSPYINDTNHGLFFGPYSLRNFAPSAVKFGKPEFTQPQNAASYIASVVKYRKKDKWKAEAVVSLLTELRYCLRVLASNPILIDTGQMIPRYKLRTFSDQQNAIANELSQQDNYVARVKTLTAEHTIRTKPLSTQMTDVELAERIGEIKRRMREQGLCRPAQEVEEEVRLRHEQLRQRNDAPPPSHTTGTNRRRYRPRPQGTQT
jgi:RecA/RadA recombinase